MSDKPKRRYSKRSLNPVNFTFRMKTNPNHRRTVHGHRMDDTASSWAVHSKVAMPGKNYLRHITEWFEKALWDVAPAKVPRKLPLKDVKPFEPPSASVVVEKAPDTKPTMESPKNAPPPITFVDDDDDTVEIPVASVAPAPPVNKAMSLNDELPGEYNPRAHKEQVAGKVEDLVIFDDIVNANYLAQQSKTRMLQLRARREGRMGTMPSPNNPVVTGFEPG